MNTSRQVATEHNIAASRELAAEPETLVDVSAWFAELDRSPIASGAATHA